MDVLNDLLLDRRQRFLNSCSTVATILIGKRRFVRHHLVSSIAVGIKFMLLSLYRKRTSHVQIFQVRRLSFPTGTLDLPVEEQPRHLQTTRDDGPQPTVRVNQQYQRSLRLPARSRLVEGLPLGPRELSTGACATSTPISSRRDLRATPRIPV